MPMRRTSKKKRTENEIRRHVLAEIVDERGPYCEARVALDCSHIAVDGHEKKRRSQGGSAIEKANILLVCRRCHDWIHRHVADAIGRGLLESSRE